MARCFRTFLSAVLVTLSLLTATSTVLAATPAAPDEGLTADPSLDRGSPRRAFEGFLRAGGRGDMLRAAHYLDLRSIPVAKQAAEAPELAQKFWYVTTHIGRFDLLKVPDDDEASIPKGETALLVGSLDDRDGPVPIAMERVKFPDGVERWIFARSTLAIAPALYVTLARPAWTSQFPAWADNVVLGNALWQWMGVLLLVPVAWLGSRLMVGALRFAFGALARRTTTHADDLLVDGLRTPVRLGVGAILFRAGIHLLLLTEWVEGMLSHVTFTLLVIAGALCVLRAMDAVAVWREEQLPKADSVTARALRRASHTRAVLFERLFAMAVIVVSVGLALLQFEIVRGVGESLLASAGVAGVVIGFAAQRSLGAIIGGIQLSLAQPIRLGDSVSIDGEYGTIDQIYLTHVVVRRWDDRRVVYPVSRFLDQSFQNLSKFGSEQTGAVVFACPAGRPLKALREALDRACKESPLWDGRVCALDVTDVTPTTLTLRVLVSAGNSDACERLCAAIRERLAPELGPERAEAIDARPRTARLA